MSAAAPLTSARGRPPLERLARLSGLVGAALGLVAGLLELTIGPSIRSWVGDKQDTTRLGLATLALAGIALGAAVALTRRPDLTAPKRFALTMGLLVPGLICFTTVGRLWYPPGVLLVAAALLGAATLRHERREIAAATGRHWAAILTVTLAGLYVFLGATALGLAGLLGVLGGLLVLVLVADRSRLSRPLALGLLLIAAAPFALLTWWSVVTPLIAALLLACGLPAITGRHAPKRPDLVRGEE